MAVAAAAAAATEAADKYARATCITAGVRLSSSDRAGTAERSPGPLLHIDLSLPLLTV
jgi:hypothetical protein